MRKVDAAMSALVRNNLIEKLRYRGIKETKDGTSIYELSEKALVREIVIAQYQEVDIDSPENKFF
jgi:Mn-dependent DtxR family transcriptional regulator